MPPKSKRQDGAQIARDPAILRREVQTQSPLSAGMEQAEGEFALFFAASLDLLCIADEDGYFKRLNPAWTVVLGWTLDELLTTPYLDLVHPDDEAATLTVLAKLAEGAATISFENRFRNKDNSYRWLQWSARPTPDGQRIYAIARDVTRQKRLEREIIEIVDREKGRMARELHDGLCQTLAGIAALSTTLSRRLPAGPQSAAAAEITGLVREAIAEARGLARGLVPVGLKGKDLGGALKTLADTVQRLFHVSCAFEGDRPFPALAPEVAAHVYRIAQEAVSNAVTHGRAQRIDIRLTGKRRRGFLSVQDDGVGMSQEMGDQDGIGLHTMAYRSRLIGGTFRLKRLAGRGILVTCDFPLPDPAEGIDGAAESD